MKKTIGQTVRELGCGTAHVPEICTYQRECDNYTEKCNPDSCRVIDRFYRRIERP